MNDLVGLSWLVVLLAFNAFFVGAEFAVIAARRSQIEPLAAQGKRSASIALKAMENATLMLATSQLGITVCSLLILGVSEPALHHLLEGALHGTGWSADVVSTISVVTAIGIVTYLHVVIGEMVPKNIAFSIPDRAVLILAPALAAFAWLFKPVIAALNGISNVLVRAVGIEPKSEAQSVFTLEEMATIVEQSQKEGVFQDRSGAVSATIEFTSKKVSDVAVPLDAIVALPDDASARDVEREVAQRGFSRYVLVNAAGEPTGYVHLKDVIGIRESEADLPVPPKRIRQLVSVYAELDLEDALAALRRTGAHIARVFDVHGTTTGVLFLEDIIEELIGEVRDATRRR
ncbi:CBS domain containing-hemolysin-like protein [Microbacteriaceae bacterium MWH-Ta3]|nr:CBS domain containing-hemolysin-like protein [Microbacteriaceae bacterium MWH-Ta3]